MEILRIENVTKTYGEKDTAVHALDRVSFSVEEGEFVAVTGPSGSGKRAGKRRVPYHSATFATGPSKTFGPQS